MNDPNIQKIIDRFNNVDPETTVNDPDTQSIIDAFNTPINIPPAKPQRKDIDWQGFLPQRLGSEAIGDIKEAVTGAKALGSALISGTIQTFYDPTEDKFRLSAEPIKTLPEFAVQIGKAIYSDFQQYLIDPAGKFQRDPLFFAMDVSGLGGLATGITSKGFRAAGMVGKATKLMEISEVLSKLSSPIGLATTALNPLRRIPEVDRAIVAMSPFHGVKKAGRQFFQRAYRDFNIGKFKRIKDVMEMFKQFDEADNAIFYDLVEKTAMPQDVIDKIQQAGGRVDLLKVLPENIPPHVLETLERWKGLADNEKQFLIDLNFLTPERAKQVVWQPLEYATGLKEATLKTLTGFDDPTYLPHGWERKFKLANFFPQNPVKYTPTSTFTFLQQRTTGGGRWVETLDPRFGTFVSPPEKLLINHEMEVWKFIHNRKMMNDFMAQFGTEVKIPWKVVESKRVRDFSQLNDILENGVEVEGYGGRMMKIPAVLMYPEGYLKFYRAQVKAGGVVSKVLKEARGDMFDGLQEAVKSIVSEDIDDLSRVLPREIIRGFGGAADEAEAVGVGLAKDLRGELKAINEVIKSIEKSQELPTGLKRPLRADLLDRRNILLENLNNVRENIRGMGIRKASELKNQFDLLGNSIEVIAKDVARTDVKNSLLNLRDKLKDVSQMIPDTEQTFRKEIKEIAEGRVPKSYVGVSKDVRIVAVPKALSDRLFNHVQPRYPEGALGSALFIYDSMSDFFRFAWLRAMPRWFVNNTEGNVLVSALAGIGPVSFVRAFEKRWKDMVPEELGPGFTSLETYIPHAGRMADTPIGQMVQFMQTNAVMNGLEKVTSWIPKFNQASEDYFRTAHYINRATKLAKRIHWQETGKFMATSEEMLAKLAEFKYNPIYFEPLIDEVNKFMFNYFALEPWERRTMRRLIPFYNWLKNINMLIYRLPFENPVRADLISIVSRAGYEVLDQEELPPEIRGTVALEKERGYRSQRVGSGGLGIVGDVLPPEATSLGKIGYHPVLNYIAASMTGKDPFTQREVMPDDTVKDFITGWKYRLNPRTNKWDRVDRVAPSIPKFMASQIPQYMAIGAFTDMIRDKLLGEKPVPIKTKEGYVYPPSPYLKLLQIFGIPTYAAPLTDWRKRDPEAIKRVESIYRRIKRERDRNDAKWERLFRKAKGEE